VATGPATREQVAEQERNAARPNLLQVANLGVLLSGGLLLASFIGLFGFLRLRKFSLGAAAR
jgi:hypothetical protein